MNARTSRLVALLVLGLASGPLFAQARQNPPAQPPQPPADDVVQKFLDAPVWYMSWRMSLVCSGSGDGWTASLQHVRHGSAQLGIRSLGPSLSILNLDPAMMQTPAGQKAFIDAIPKYANWIAMR